MHILAFNAYVILTHCLRRSFISVKGIYHQVEINGQFVTWIVPYHLRMETPSNIDFRVIESFINFYITLLQFVIDHLFHDIGLDYTWVLRINIKNELDGNFTTRTRLCNVKTCMSLMHIMEQN